jgi:hypothetical protein
MARYYDIHEAEIAYCVQKLAPLVEILRAFSTDLGMIEGLEIAISASGGGVTVSATYGAGKRTSHLSAGLGNLGFTLQQRAVDSLSRESILRTQECADSYAALMGVMKAVDEHVENQKEIV